MCAVQSVFTMGGRGAAGLGKDRNCKSRWTRTYRRKGCSSGRQHHQMGCALGRETRRSYGGESRRCTAGRGSSATTPAATFSATEVVGETAERTEESRVVPDDEVCGPEPLPGSGHSCTATGASTDSFSCSIGSVRASGGICSQACERPYGVELGDCKHGAGS